ncbi:MAG: ATP-binding protein [Elusimicrobia bacterium]|nr:ATP-binding protein [Elusimicrobiota bacterium]MBP9698984.1 ATP-binding protein [Elusimicrobiota bacterium]
MLRTLSTPLMGSIHKWRCSALLGPRQAGKTTLLRRLVNGAGVFIDFDDPLVRAEARHDPVSFLRAHRDTARMLVIDEAAKVPEIFDAVKVLVDEGGKTPSRILLATSGNYLMLNRIRETLAGRVHLLRVYPFAWGEEGGDPGLLQLNSLSRPMASMSRQALAWRRSRESFLVEGGFPPLAGLNSADKDMWFRDYTTTYVAPLVSEHFRLRDIGAFETFARLALMRTSQTVNLNALAPLVGVSLPTLQSYADILDAMMVTIRLEPFSRNPSKRLIKHPKWHAVDPGLARHAMGIRPHFTALAESGNLGPLYESFVVMETMKVLAHRDSIFNLYHWRTADGAEVDAVLEMGGDVWALGAKASPKLSPRMMTGLKSFLEDNPGARGGLIVYPGTTIQKLDRRIWAVPDGWLFGR